MLPDRVSRKDKTSIIVKFHRTDLVTCNQLKRREPYLIDE